MKEYNNVLYKVRNIENIKDLLNQSAKLFSNKPAYKLKEPGRKTYRNISYRRLRDDVNALGTALINLGLKDKRIAIIGENSYSWAISYFATVCGTGIVVPLDKMLPENEIESLLERSEVSAVIYSETYADCMNKFKENNLNIQHYIQMDSKLPKLIEKGKELINEGNKEFIDAKIDNEVMSILLFTSGTTAMSKAVMLSHSNVCSNIMSVCKTVKVKPKDSSLSFLPIHHTYECTIGFLLVLYCGASIVFCEGLRHIAKNLKESKVTVMICVPLLFENMYKKVWVEIDKQGKRKLVEKMIKISNFLRKYLKINLSRLFFKSILKNFGGKIRLFITGAAGIDTEVARGFSEFGVKVLQGYGLTETAPLITGCNDKMYKYGTCGYPIPGVEVKIDDPNEEGIGEIISRGPNVMLGYFNNEEATNEVLKDGWFYTGDLGYFDEDNCLVISGRKKSVIVLKNGKNIFPEELETLLNHDDFIKESFVFGKEDKDGDTQIWAKVVANKEKLSEKFGDAIDDLQIKEIIQSIVKKINKDMPAYKYIRNIKVSAEDLIKTTTQKIKRHEEIKKMENEEKEKKD